MELEKMPKEDNAIAINLEKESFAKFILEFLGTKENLAYETYASFQLNHNDIEQFYYLLEAKVAKERNLILDHFYINLIYDDGTRREFSGIDNLKQFNETRYVSPITITLTWNLITGFPNAKTIENQIIELTFNTKKLKENKEQGIDEGEIKLLIKSTNQAWANEILHLFREQINNVIIKKSFGYKCMKKVNQISLNTLVLIMLFMFMGLNAFMGKSDNSPKRFKFSDELSYKISEKLIQQGDPYVEFFNFAIHELSTEQIKEVSKKEGNLKNSVLLSQLIESKEKRERMDLLFISGLFLVMAFMIVIVFYPNYALKYYGSNSYLILTKKAEQAKAEEIDSKGKIKFISFTALVWAIFIGIVINWVSIIVL